MGKDANGVAYQPKGVIDPKNGKAYQLSKLNGGTKVADLFKKKGNENSSGVNIDSQNVWVANGKYYIWNGSKNQYERIK